jgi:ribonuclease HI
MAKKNILDFFLDAPANSTPVVQPTPVRARRVAAHTPIQSFFPTQPTSAPIQRPAPVSELFVYTDGSCSNNGQPGAQAGMGVYFGPGDPRNLAKRVVGKQSNNTGELGAMIEAYRILEKEILAGKPITIVSDSNYAIRAVTTYGQKCAEKGWAKDIPNKDMVQYAYNLFHDKPNVKFHQVLGHTGGSDPHSVGNDGADRLANQAIGLNSCPYAQAQPPTQSKLYLDVAFAQKDEAKALGALWDPAKKKWYMKEGNPHRDELLEKFGRS